MTRPLHSSCFSLRLRVTDPHHWPLGSQGPGYLGKEAQTLPTGGHENRFKVEMYPTGQRPATPTAE